ncbi:hypothetical protein FOMPIDRAFT_1044980 [Fomitopsis schrenkii]|uniref:Rhodopsin domain-containing protein n=1 Tax=Fomitopsis schrenkii TaxID=2126942 RepID=S8ENB8_FOMSC|nr:hypothetical protein FOMPIDRAFT_1044980 [Fomitopsis schrenkii]
MVEALLKLKLTSAICSFFAVATTCYRLSLRGDRFWWDDACAFISMVFLLLQIASVFMHLDDPHVLTHLDRVAAYYIMAATFYTIIWTARLAILYSVIRINPSPKARRVCEPMPEWRNAVSPQCPLDKQVAICQLVTDILADLLLIIAPLRLIWGMSAEDGTRRRLMIIFSTSIVTTIVSLVHAALILTDGGIKVVIAAIVEDTFSLIVCNLPVVVTAIMRKAGQPDEDTDHATQSTFGWRVATRTGKTFATTTGTVDSGTAMGLTTVNLRDLTTHTATVLSNPTLTQIEQTHTVQVVVDGDHKEDAAPHAPPQRSIVWITPEALHGTESREDVDK